MTPSITSFRRQVATIVANRPGRNVIVLAVDGIPYDVAVRTWRSASVTRARSVFPTTSSTAWLSSLTGESVDAHGIPGVVFEVDGALVDVYAHKGSLGAAPREDLFSDAAQAGYTPVAILGDLEDTHCTWRDLLVHRAAQVNGHRFFWRPEPLDPAAMTERIAAAVNGALAAHSSPCLVWCFIDSDRHIHHHGYDAALIEFLERIDALACSWATDAVVIAHSDHGLVPTRQVPDVARVLDEVMAAESRRTGRACRMGGAGRTRWLYVEPTEAALVRDDLIRRLPSTIDVRHADELFAPGSLARSRVGSIVLIARGEGFLAADDYAYEHGSLTETELDVPLAEWRA